MLRAYNLAHRRIVRFHVDCRALLQQYLVGSPRTSERSLHGPFAAAIVSLRTPACGVLPLAPLCRCACCPSLSIGVPRAHTVPAAGRTFSVAEQHSGEHHSEEQARAGTQAMTQAPLVLHSDPLAAERTAAAACASAPAASHSSAPQPSLRDRSNPPSPALSQRARISGCTLVRAVTAMEDRDYTAAWRQDCWSRAPTPRVVQASFL